MSLFGICWLAPQQYRCAFGIHVQSHNSPGNIHQPCFFFFVFSNLYLIYSNGIVSSSWTETGARVSHMEDQLILERQRSASTPHPHTHTFLATGKVNPSYLAWTRVDTWKSQLVVVRMTNDPPARPSMWLSHCRECRRRQSGSRAMEAIGWACVFSFFFLPEEHMMVGGVYCFDAKWRYY